MVSSRTVAAAPLSNTEWRTYERVAAVVALIGIFSTFFGLSWDIQWHADVGPDTFWTVPHLFVYAGAAMTGFACLTAVLISTMLAQRSKRADWIRVLGRFYAPVGFVVGGFGSLGFLLFGFFDQWWHTVFGFDVALSSPPHIGLILSLITSMVGAMMIFVQGRRVKPLEFSVALAINLGFTMPVLMMLFWELRQTFQFLVLPALFIPITMMLAASVTRNIWWAFGVLVAFGVFRQLYWVIIPLLDQAYADSLGLAIRDTSRGFPFIPFFMPILAPLVGLLAALGLWFWKARGWNANIGVTVVAAIVTPVVFLDGNLIKLNESPVLILATALLAAFSGWLGWQLGVVARHSNKELEATSA
jgi:hypothetical protein